MLYAKDGHRIFMCLIVFLNIEKIGFGEKNQVSISNIEEYIIYGNISDFMAAILNFAQ